MIKNNIILISNFHNDHNYFYDFHQSVKNQKYVNYHCYVLANNSSDMEILKTVTDDDDRFSVILGSNDVVRCLDYLLECNILTDDTICVILDCKDKFLSEYALTIINDIYNDNPNVLLTHGDYIDSADDKKSNQFPYNELRFKHLRRLGAIHEKIDNEIGYAGWEYNCSHLKTFKGILFKELIKQDKNFDFITYNGEIINTYYDEMYYMTPLMEIAGLANIYYNPIPLVWHRNLRPPVDIDYSIINNKPKFKSIDEQNNKRVIIYAQGGLGDHLSLSTLPKEYSLKGYDVYLHPLSNARNPDIIPFVWLNNPNIKGILKEHELRPNDIILGHNKEINLNGKEFITCIEESNGIFDTDNVLPKIYYEPNIIQYLQGKTILNLDCISASYEKEDVYKITHNIIELLKIESSDILLLNFTVNVNQNINYNRTEFKSFNELNYPKYNCSNIEEHCDIINSCKHYITLMSGGASLAAAIDKDRNKTFVIVNNNEHRVSSIIKSFIFPNQNYIW